MPITAARQDEIDDLWSCLPCQGYDEAAEKMNSVRHTRFYDRGNISSLIYCVRQNSAELKWTIPHTRRGLNATGAERLFAVPVREDGSYLLDENLDSRSFMEDGFRTTVLAASTMLAHAQRVLLTCMTQTRSRLKKAQYDDMADSSGFMSRKLRRLAEEVEEQGDGTNG